MRKREPNKKVMLTLMIVVIVPVLLLGNWVAAARGEQKCPDRMAIVAASAPSGAYAASVAFSKFAMEEWGLKASVLEAGSSGRRTKMVLKGDGELAVSIGYYTIEHAWNGTGAWEKKGHQPIRLVFRDAVIGMHLISLKKRNIKSIPDLRGKKVMYVSKGIAFYKQVMDLLLKYHGMTPNDLTPLKFGSSKEITAGIKAGTIDAGPRMGTRQGTGHIMDFARKNDVNIMSFSDAEMNYLQSKVPFMSKMIVKAGLYHGIPNDLLVPAAIQFTITNEDVSDDCIYQSCKLFFKGCGLDTPGRFVKIHPSKDFTLRSACPLPYHAPYHPGAVRFFKEKGVWTKAHERMQKKVLEK